MIRITGDFAFDAMIMQLDSEKQALIKQLENALLEEQGITFVEIDEEDLERMIREVSEC